ncbi:hypothetical protein PAMA_015868 [Pampus argenteus]
MPNYTFSWVPKKKEYIEEEIEREIEEEIEEEIKEEIEAIVEDPLEEPAISNRENYCYTPFSEEGEEYADKVFVKEAEEEIEEELLKLAEKAEEQSIASNRKAALEEALENEQRANSQIKESLEKEKNAKAALKKALENEQRVNFQIKESLEKEKNAKAALKKALEQEQKAKKILEKSLQKSKQTSSRHEIEDLKTQIADLSKSLKKHRHSNEKLKAKMSKMLVDREEDKKVIEKLEKLKNDLEMSSCQREKQIAERDRDISVQITALKERIIKLQDESLSKDNEIQSLLLNIENLKGDIDSRDNTVSSLHEKVNQLMSNLKDHQSLICSLQKERDDAVAQQTSTDELDHLTRQNQQLSCENTKLQGDLKVALKEKEIAVNQLEEAKKGCSKKQEIIDKENTKFQKMLQEKLQTLEAELLEKNVALEKSLTAKQYLKSSLKNKQKLTEKLLSQQAAANPSMFLSNQQRGAHVPSEHIMYDMQTLKMENADIRAKFRSMEVEYEYKKRSLTDQYEEQIAKKNAIISDNQAVIDKLHSTVFDLKAQQSDSKFREKKLEDDLKQETQRCSRLQKRVDEIATSLQREQTTREKHRVELKESLIKQIEITEERYKLSVALQKAQDVAFRLQEQQQAETMYRFRKLQDTELKYTRLHNL